MSKNEEYYEKFKELYDTLTYAEIAKTLNIKQYRVAQIRNELGLEKKKGRKGLSIL